MKISSEQEGMLAARVRRFQQRVFALALYLTGGNRDQAYAVAAESFVEVMRKSPVMEKDDFLTALCGVTVRLSRGVTALPVTDTPDFKVFPGERRELLRMLIQSLQALSFELKAGLLLRDQLHLSYANISRILPVSEPEAKTLVSQARKELRKKIKAVLVQRR